MKTTLSTILLIWIALGAYSQGNTATDSITLSNWEYAEMYRDIRAGELCIVKSEAKTVTINLLTEELHKKNKWYRKPKFWAATGSIVGVLTGVFIAK